MMPIKRSWCVFFLCVMGGCTQQDTDCLARIGRKLVDRSQGAAGTLRNQVDVLPHVAAPTKDSGLKEKVEARLRWDALLADVRIEVVVNGSEVELKGTVRNDAQRRRAGDLSETTAGVQAVNDSLRVEE